MNIDFERDGYRFNARASAIILNENKSKILLFKVEDGRDYFLLPGGRIEHYEDGITAIKREIKEELGYDLEYELFAIQENFVIKDKVKITQYNFCYKAIYDGLINDEKFVCKDNDNQYFYWVDIDRLPEYKVYPKSVYELVKTNELKHIIER